MISIKDLKNRLLGQGNSILEERKNFLLLKKENELTVIFDNSSSDEYIDLSNTNNIICQEVNKKNIEHNILHIYLNNKDKQERISIENINNKKEQCNLNQYFIDFEKKFPATKDLKINAEWYQSNLNVYATPNVSIKPALDVLGNFSEEYIRARFVYSLIQSGKFNIEQICVEATFQKGNNGKSINPDIVIFKNDNWKQKLEQDILKGFSDLTKDILMIFEAKKNDKNKTSSVIEKQLLSAMKEYTHDETSTYKNEVFGCYFDDSSDVILFKKEANFPLKRLYENKIKEDGENKWNIDNRDLFRNIPSYNELIEQIIVKDISSYTYNDLEPLNEDTFNDILKKFNRLRDRFGINPNLASKYLIEFLAIKIYEEKNNKKETIKYYYKKEEDNKIFKERIFNLQKDSKNKFPKIYKNSLFNYEKKDNNIILKNENEIELFFIETIQLFQEYSILKGSNSSFNQVIFNNFSSMSDKAENKQFFTPIFIIDFIINLTNPKSNEFICDPTSGICDFLAMTFKKLSLEDSSFGSNLYGFDIDEEAVKLASLNMLFNGDGAANISKVNNSLTSKLKEDRSGFIIDENFTTDNYSIEDWEGTREKIFKDFDLIMTNPPFGKGRDLKCDYKKGGDNAILPEKTIKLYETYWFKNNPCYINGKFRTITELQSDLKLSKKELEKLGRKEITFPNSMDLGALFLENSVKLLKEGGRMAIVISSSIASIQEWENVRQWFMSKMRIVAVIDLPANIFAETGVSTTIIVAYKPKNKDILNSDYSVFIKDIKKFGYEVKVSDRMVNFIPKFKINEETFELLKDENESLILDEEMTESIIDFNNWKILQEQELREVF